LNEISLDRPTLVFSLDAELAWGYHDLNMNKHYERCIECARSSWMEILDLFDKYQIPATWAIVGHLFLDKCDGKHEDHPADDDWFQNDPGGTINENPNWFGTDLIKQILDKKIEHEIACHSFSHVEFDSVEREIAESELQHSIEAANIMNINFESFVYPRNKVAHRDLLKEYGFKSYRGVKPLSENNNEYPEKRMIRNSIRKGGLFLDYFTPIRINYSTVNPIIDEFGLVNIPASLFIFGFQGKSRLVSEKFFADPVVLKVKKEIDHLIKNKGILHLWFHPNNLTQDKDFERLIEILEYVNQKKNKTKLEVKTMKILAKEVKMLVKNP